MRFVFGTNQCMVDRLFGPVAPGSIQRIVPQGLFEFLTPMNESQYLQDTLPNKEFPISWALQWTGDPYLQVEWVQYQEMLPIYRLRGYRYQLVKSPEFVIPMPTEVDNLSYVPARVIQECLAVPNKVYVWGELSESSGRAAYAWGGII